MDKHEENLIRALDLPDKGVDPKKILARFPEHKTDLLAIFEAVQIIENGKSKIFPSENSLKELLMKIPVGFFERESQPQMSLLRKFGFTGKNLAIPAGALIVLLAAAITFSQIKNPDVAEAIFDINSIENEALAADFDNDLYELINQKVNSNIPPMPSDFSKTDPLGTTADLKEQITAGNPRSELLDFEAILPYFKKFNNGVVDRAKSRKNLMRESILGFKASGKNTFFIEMLLREAEFNLESIEEDIKSLKRGVVASELKNNLSELKFK